ncbi:retrovirus-related pol polyprotein from transposon TNT 1-94 [Tanacetum coccineum]
MKRKSFKLAKVVVSQKRRYWSIKGNSCDSKGHGLSEPYKVTHTEVSSIGKNDAIAGNLKEVQSSSLSREKIRQVGEQIGVKWHDVDGGNRQPVGPDVLTLQETQCAIIDEFWIKEVWGNRNVGYVKMEAKGRSRGMVMMWDNNMFSCLEAVREERFIAVRGGRRFTWISDDGLKFSKLDWFLVSEEFKNKWSSLSAIALDRKLSDHCPIMLKDIDMDFGPKPFRVYDMWLEEVDIEQELEAEMRMLEDNKVAIWLVERRAWIEKDRKRANMLKQKIKVSWDVERDENSKFFHSMIKRRNNKKQMNSRPSFANERVKKLSDEDVSGEKMPGPDGFNFKFIKRFWSIFRPDKVGKMVLGNKGDIEELHISLIGCYYKIMAKILAERVKKVVGKIVGDVPSGFIEGIWKWKWEWVREPRGRANGETWLLEDKGRFTVKALSKMVDNKYLHEEDSRQETVWNKIVPKKVNIFIWRALKGRLPVRSELDKRVNAFSTNEVSWRDMEFSLGHFAAKSPLGRGVSYVGIHLHAEIAYGHNARVMRILMFLVYLDCLEPYLMKILENGPFMPMSPLSTFANPLTKPQKKWSPEDRHLANQDKRLNSLDSDLDVEEDTRSNNEFLADLNIEFHDRALLSNQKRYYKRFGRVGSAKKPIVKTKESCYACGKIGHFQKDCPSTKTSTPSYPSSNKSYIKPKFQSNTTPQHNKSDKNHQKDYKEKYKGLKAEVAILPYKGMISMSKGKSAKGLLAESFD